MKVAAVVLATLFAAGCSSPCCPQASTGAWASAGAPPPAASVAKPPSPKPGEIVDHRDGSRVAFDAMADRLASASVVYAGERHDQALHHEFQTRLFAELLDRWQGKPVAIGMEMFQKPWQKPLDAYVAGEIDEATMLERTEWKKRWGGDEWEENWRMYGPMVRLARERHVPVIALNAAKEVTGTVARKGLEGLSAEDRAALPPLDLSNAAHRAFVKEAFGAHGKTMKPETFEHFYTAQVIWEETMSSSVADWLSAHGPDAHVFVVVGGGHVGDRFGIPARADKKSGRHHLAVMLEVAPDDDPRLDVGYADYSAWFADSTTPKHPKKPEAGAPPSPAKPDSATPDAPKPAVPAPAAK